MSNDKIKQWRQRCGLSQEQAAHRLGITLRNYQNYEAGRYQPPQSIRMLMTAVRQGIRLEPTDTGSEAA